MVQRQADHITCLDGFGLPSTKRPPGRGHEGLVDALCRNPFERRNAERLWPVTVPLLPGLEVLDLYSESEMTEIWKDGQIYHCLVPRSVVGWEFFSLLWPQPDGTAPLKLSDAVELLGARPPMGAVSPSLLFAFVPAQHEHPGAVAWHPSNEAQRGRTQSKARAKSDTSLQALERASGNLDASNRSIAARLFVLCPCSVYKDSAEMPGEQHWGLFIGPRSRSLVLLNRNRGRIDLHLATLLAVDAAYRLCAGLVSAVARLFAPFGSQDQVPSLFGPQLNPLRVHSGLTNAAVADHVSATLDGREDYRRFFGLRLPFFFLSNASNNLCFLTPAEAEQLRVPGRAAPHHLGLGPLPDLPLWTLKGHLLEADRSALLTYRSHVPPLQASAAGGSLLDQLLGGPDSKGGEGWLSSLMPGVCQEVTFGGHEGDGAAAPPGHPAADRHHPAAVPWPGQHGQPQPTPWHHAGGGQSPAPGGWPDSRSEGEQEVVHTHEVGWDHGGAYGANHEVPGGAYGGHHHDVAGLGHPGHEPDPEGGMFVRFERNKQAAGGETRASEGSPMEQHSYFQHFPGRGATDTVLGEH